MVKNKFAYGIIAIFVLILGGCVSVSNSPNARFYALHAIDNQASSQLEAKGLVIGVGPVKIPEYLNRPQIVNVNKDRTLSFSEFNRWAEAIDFALERIINENLAGTLNGATIEMFPWDRAVPVKYQVIANVIRLENEFNERLIFVVQWSIIDLEKKNAIVTKRSEFIQPINPHNYSGLANVLSEAGALLSSEIAQQINSIQINLQNDKVVPK
ncbi:MAG: PqiC family protein [Candidatus Omnitrophota bacterium]|jgi:hypothetical protein